MLYAQLYETAKQDADITPEEWEEFAQSFVMGQAQKGETLLSHGDDAKYIWVVVSGVMRNFDNDSKGKEYTKVFRGPGEMLGPYSEILAKSKTRYSIQAVTQTTFIRFPYAHFEMMMDKYPRWERLGRKIAEKNFLEKEKREYDLMHLSAEERYQEFLKQYGELAQQIPQYQVASWLAISPEALNRLLKGKKA